MTAPIRTLEGNAPMAEKHLRILYADDTPELRDIMRIMLSREGHGIECAEDGLTALRRIEGDKGFDVVITDHQMPNMTGLELVGELRARGFRGKIMVLSSEISAADVEGYRKLGVDRIFYKPVYRALLRAALAEVMESARHDAARV